MRVRSPRCGRSKRCASSVPRRANREAFARRFTQELGVPVKAAASAKDAVTGATLVVGATRTLDGKPVFESAWLTPEMLVASIGATLPEHIEIDTAAIERCDLIVADMPGEVMEETGCFRAAHAAGIRFEDKFVSLNDAHGGQGRRSAARGEAADVPLGRCLAPGSGGGRARLSRGAAASGLATELPMELSVKAD